MYVGESQQLMRRWERCFLLVEMAERLVVVESGTHEGLCVGKRVPALQYWLRP